MLEKEIYPEEFEAFFEAMVEEMKRHREKKGDSWRNDKVFLGCGNCKRGIWKPMSEHLQSIFRRAVMDYLNTGERHQLVDIADICGMIWCRNE